MPKLTLQLFGGFRASYDGSELDFPTKKGEGLLAYLAMPAGQLHTREKLAGLLWGGFGEEQARQSLRQTLFSLRKIVNQHDEIVQTEGDRIGLDAAKVEVDVAKFKTLVRESTPESLEKAVVQYRGEFLDGIVIDEIGFESWLTAERESLRESALSALSKLLQAQTDHSHNDAAVQTALRLVAIDPLRESAHRALMRLYLRQGRRDAAIKQFHSLADAMRRQLRVEPDRETRALYDEILAAGERAMDDTAAKKGDERIQLLLVEDNALNRQLVQSMLDSSKYRVVVAEDGGQALLELGRRRFDVILLDIKLPNVDGFTMLKVIRDNGYQTPTILMTAMPGPEPEIQGLELGAADFVRKPIQKDVLLARIDRVLKRSTA